MDYLRWTTNPQSWFPVVSGDRTWEEDELALAVCIDVNLANLDGCPRICFWSLVAGNNWANHCRFSIADCRLPRLATRQLEIGNRQYLGPPATGFAPEEQNLYSSCDELVSRSARSAMKGPPINISLLTERGVGKRRRAINILFLRSRAAESSMLMPLKRFHVASPR